MERNPISKEIQTRDALLLSLSGGLIGIIGLIAENNILSASKINANDAFMMGEATLVGFSLSINGTVRFLKYIKSSKNI